MLKVLLKTESAQDLANEFWLPISILHELQLEIVNATNASSQEDTWIEDLSTLEYGAAVEAKISIERNIGEITEDI